VRKGTTINLSGTFHCVGDNIISWQNVIHCADSITLDRYASTNEYVSIIDSTHHHDGEHPFFYENVSAAPISIGRNTWVCNKASVLMGVRIGHNCVIASHAVVNKDVPDGMVVGGMPAKVIGRRQVAGPAEAFFEPNERTVLSLDPLDLVEDRIQAERNGADDARGSGGAAEEALRVSAEG
jgi:acetyltransferase-like isoleucine patch superfamily enzyme